MIAHDAALERFASVPVARLATASASGTPHLVPICFAVLDGAVWSVVDDKPKPTTSRLRRLRNIEANARVSVLADRYDDDWSRLWFVRVDGEASIVRDDPAWSAAFAVLRAKYPPYRSMALAPQTHPMIRIAIRHVHAWSATGA